MKLRRTLCRAALALAALALLPGAQAQTYPARPITMIVPYGAGGGTDVLARAVAAELGKRLNQAIVVENVPGAGGVIGTQKAMNAAADGYTLLMGSGSELEIMRLTDPGAVPAGRWTPMNAIGLIGTQPMVLVGRANLPFQTTDQLIEHLRAQPGSLSYASAGVGTQLHLLGELLKQVGRFDMVHVPYKSGTQIATDVVGGHVDLAVMVLPTILSQVQAGKVKAFGISDTRRSPAAPDIPLLDDGRYLQDIDMKVWYGLFAPAGTPAPVVQALAAALGTALDAQEVARKLGDMAITPAADHSPQALAALKENQLARIRKVIEATRGGGR